MVYVDSSRPELVDGFTKRTFTAKTDGVFCDTFFKGIGEKLAGKERAAALGLS